ncbi:MAG TPA: hypothetical protein VN639_03670 [Azonexus sp.]|nr:hypothetical protein [Azonexus sp.]
MTMNFTALSALSIVVLIGLNLAAWLQILKLRRSWRNPVAADNAYLGLQVADYSKDEPPSVLKEHDEIDPLTEAEIFVIYGRRADAQRVLESGLRRGRISAEEVTMFWAGQEARSHK